VQEDNAPEKFYRLVRHSSGAGAPGDLAPLLRRSGQSWIIAWPSTAQGYVLQSRSNFNEYSPWVDVALKPLQIGTEFQIQEKDASEKFYRLVRPTFQDAGAASASNDFVASQGVLTFAPGEVEKTIPLATLGDLLDEADEEFYVRLSNASGAPIAIDQAVVTIENDDPPGR
jgi:hypothetical protein